MSYIKQYDELMTLPIKTSANRVRPRNIYKIRNYVNTGKNTKTGSESRYIFVLGKINNQIHCIKLNDVKPSIFGDLLFELYDKRTDVQLDQELETILKKFGADGKQLFEQHIKSANGIYGKGTHNYRVYSLDKIREISEIRYEFGFLRKLMKLGSTTTTRNEVITTEINEKDG